MGNSPEVCLDPLKPMQSPTNVTLESHISAAGDVTKKPKEIFAVDPEPRPNKDLGQVHYRTFEPELGVG